MWDDFLAGLGAGWTGRLCRYEGAHLVDCRSFTWPGGDAAHAEVSFAGVTWRCEYQSHAVVGRPEAVDLLVRFRAQAGAADGLGVSAALTFAGWSTENYVVMPVAVYAGNRFVSCRLPYPPLVLDPALRGVDVPTMITDAPRLNVAPGPLRASSCWPAT